MDYSDSSLEVSQEMLQLGAIRSPASSFVA